MTEAARSSVSTTPEVAGLNLGTGPVPQSGPDWEHRIRQGVLSLIDDEDGDGDAARLWEQVRVQVVPAGTDLGDVRVDLTGMRLEEHHRSLRLDGADLTDVPPVASAEPVTVHHLEVLAQPIHVEGIPVTAHVEVEDIPAGVAYDGRENLWALMDPGAATAQSRGHGQVSVPIKEAVERAKDLVAAELANSGLTLTSLQVEVKTPSARRLHLDVTARVRKGLLSASAQIRLEAEVDSGMVARIGEIQARSGNPLVSLVLVVVRKKLARYTDTTIDLNAQMPPGLRLVDLSMDAGKEFTAHVRFA